MLCVKRLTCLPIYVQFLQAIEGSGGSDASFRCAPCDRTVGSHLGMMSHLRTAIHHQNVTQWRLAHGEAILERIVTVCKSQQEFGKIQICVQH